jgi:hypothetical protein
VRFLGIILRVLRLEVSIYIVHILHNSFKPHFLKSVSRVDCGKKGRKFLRLLSQYVQEFGLSIRYPQLYKDNAEYISSEQCTKPPVSSSLYLLIFLFVFLFPLSKILCVLYSPLVLFLHIHLLFCFLYPPSYLTKVYIFQYCLFLRTVHSSIFYTHPSPYTLYLSVSCNLQALSDLFPYR